MTLPPLAARHELRLITGGSRDQRLAVLTNAELGRRGPVNQRALADALKVTPRAVTGLVDALADSGLVTREPHPTDRRATLVTVTAKGEALVGRLQRDHRTLARAIFGAMSRREFDSFASGLGEVITNLRKHLDSRLAS